MTLRSGEHIGVYQIVEQLGVGGMATVYKAHHARLNRDVAIKVMHHSFLQDPSFKARFEREAQIVAKLEHPNIVPIYDFNEHQGQPYLVMKIIDGRTLKNKMSGGLLSLDEILRVMTPIADALTYAHSLGVLHRDVKPANIVLADDGKPYLTDFGLARIAQLGESTLSTDMMIGTPHYISPEQAQGQRDLDGRTDVYSLGVVLYEQVCGRVPFVADTPYAIVHDHIYKPLPKPSTLNPEIPAQVERVLEKALAKDRDERYASPNEMMNAFRQAVEESGLQALRDDRAESAAINLRDLLSTPVPASVKPAVPAAPARPTPPTAPPAPSQPNPPQQKSGTIRVDGKEVDLGEMGEQLGQWLGKWGEDFGRRAEQWGTNFGRRAENWGKRFEQSANDFSPDNKGIIPLAEHYTDDESRIRREYRRRERQRWGFFIHLGIFLISLTIINAAWGAGMGAIIGEGDVEGWVLQLLQTLPVPLLVALSWGQGVTAHALSVFYNTGGRLNARRRHIARTLRARHGEHWEATTPRGEYQRVSRAVERRQRLWLRLLQHGVSAVMNTALLFVVWAVMLPLFPQFITEPTWLINLLSDYTVPIALTGVNFIILLIHALIALTGSISAENRESAIQREIELSRQMSGVKLKNDLGEKPKHSNDEAVRLTGDGEFTDSFIAEMSDQDRALRGE